MTEQIQNLKKFRFIPEITLGNVLQLLSIAAAVIGLWVNMDKRISAVELRESYSIEERRDMKKSLATLAENQAVMARTVDRIVDASVCGSFLFGLLPPDDSRVAETVGRVREKLGCATQIGGLARYENDAYYRSASDTPGNPWFVTTLWYAQYVIATARTVAELVPAMEILEWTAAHALPSGVLAEQLDPHTGKPLSVSPLTWSHAAFITTVCEYRQKRQQLKGVLK